MSDDDGWWQVAERQAGAITGTQFGGGGAWRAERNRLTRSGILARAGRDLFVVPALASADPIRHGLWVAVLRAGPGAALFRISAAALWGLDGDWNGSIEVAMPAPRQSRSPTAHRIKGLKSEHVTQQHGLPVTTVARTLVDLGGAVSGDEVERALESALRRRLVTVDEALGVAFLARSQGARLLRQVTARRPAGAAPTESDAETLFLQAARAAGLSEPRRQFAVLLGGRRYRLDFAWPEVRLAAEVDGFQVHGQPSALRADLRRQNQIVLDGWLILRFAWLDVARHAVELVIPDLRAAWSLRGGRPVAGS